MEISALGESLAARLSRSPAATAGVDLFWLGQAGFLLEAAGRRILIDPYLSDSLGAKYAGSATPHDRMMAPPVLPDALGPVDLVLCTHRHTDHMDPGTLRPLGARLPDLRFVAPAAERAEALARTGVPADRIVPMEAGQRRELLPGIAIAAVRAAHETLETDADGRHRFLGYAIEADGVTVFHSGDTVPFLGQIEEVAALRADVALLPVNGRSPALSAAGIAGNMSVGEAVSLARATRIPVVIAHHYGLFGFNTVAPEAIDAAAAMAAPVRLERARTAVRYHWARRATPG
ncbi:MBL fold metallo-hydrolase [Aureimonas sp. Leaf454]|nr:MBL fold metallo-hydrolase [Aureimonas sp. Leaf454]